MKLFTGCSSSFQETTAKTMASTEVATKTAGPLAVGKPAESSIHLAAAKARFW